MNPFTTRHKNPIARILLSGLHYDIAGSILLSIGICVFTEHSGYIQGGASGLALILNHLYGIPVGVASLLINIPLVILSWKILGREFIYKTIRSLVVATLFLDVIFPMLPYYQGDQILSAVFAGAFTGAGLAVFYMHGSSSGGADFIIMSVRAKHPYIPAGYIAIAIDVVIISAGWPVFGNINAVLYALIS